jgi:DNA replication protein DnaC
MMALDQMKGNLYQAAMNSGGRRQIVLPNSTQCEVCERFKVDDPDYIRLTQGHRFAVACICAKKEEEQRQADLKRIAEANLPNPSYPHTFETWDRGTEGTAEIAGAAHRFARREGPTVLVMVGGTGAGKSHLLEAIGRHALDQGRTVVYETSKSLLDNLQSTYDRDNPETFRYRMDWYQTRGVLLLDDVGAETSTEWRISQLTDLIEHRIQYEKPMAVTTNLDRDEMIDKLGPRIGSRLFATNPGLPIKLVVTTAKDYRR